MLSRVRCSTDDAGTANQTRSNVVDDVSVEIRRHHDIELMRIGHQLHGGVVDNHLLELDSWIKFSHLFAASQEQSIAQLHDVGLVNGGDLLAVVLGGVVEGELCDSQRLGLGDDFEALDDTGNCLVLES